MLNMRNLNLISVQSWTYLQSEGNSVKGKRLPVVYFDKYSPSTHSPVTFSVGISKSDLVIR